MKSKYTKELVEKILSGIREGRTYKESCYLAGIGEAVFYEWQQKRPEFAEQVKKAKEDFNNTIVKEATISLLKLIKGYDVEEKKVEYGADAHGNPIIKKQTTTTKHIAPNPTMIIFALSNRDPENWKNRQFTEVNGKVETDSKTDVNLSNVPDDLLAKVIDSIKGE